MIKSVGFFIAIIFYLPYLVQTRVLHGLEIADTADDDSDLVYNVTIKDKDDPGNNFHDVNTNLSSSLRKDFHAVELKREKRSSGDDENLELEEKPLKSEDEVALELEKGEKMENEESLELEEPPPEIEQELEKEKKKKSEDENALELEKRLKNEQDKSTELKKEEKIQEDKFEDEKTKNDKIKYKKSKKHLFGTPEPEEWEDFEEFTHHNHSTINFNEILNKNKKSLNQSNHFSYNHPEEWSLDNPECSGKHQSPVNLDSNKLVGLDLPSNLNWNGYWHRPQDLTIIDNGHSVELSGKWDEKKAPFINGGPLIGDYLFAQLHFHWGREDTVGSEHTINNQSFPMEMHMVHYKKDYGSLGGALKHDDGLAVVAFLFEMGETANLGVTFLENSLSKIQNKPKTRVPVKSYPLGFLHFVFHEDYVSYIGSLTTPPCREIVTWMVSSTPLTISHKQLESFRKISNNWPEKENYRPRQALNDRNLYYVPQ